MRHPHAFAPRRRARGFTLVEALVALLALSIGLLGVAGLQLAGLRNNMSSSWRTQATYLSYDILDRMRANRDNLNSYIANYGAAPTVGGIPEADLIAWKANLAAALPLGDGSVAVDPVTRDVTVNVRWDDSRGADANLLVFTMRSRL